MKTIFYKISLIFSLILLVSVFSACGSSGDFDKGNADAVFAIMSGTEVSASDDDFVKLINIDGKTFDSSNGLSFEIEDPTIISLTSTSGIIKSNEVDSDKVTTVKVSYGDSATTIKVVVVKDYNLDEYKDYSNVIIPYGVKEVGDALKGSGIESLTIPSTAVSFAPKAFDGCESLKEVSLNSNAYHFSEGCFKGCVSLESVTIPYGVVSLDNNLFRQCSALKNIEIPDSVQELGEFCFYSDYSLESVVLPEGVNYISERAFANCSALSSINIPDGITAICDDTFSSCTSLASISLPDTIVSIGERAFLKCESLTELDIPEYLDSIGLDAFSNCISITSISVPATFRPLEAAFNGVTRIREIYITGEGKGADYSADNYTCSPWYSSRKNSINVHISEGVSSIGDYTFVYCSGLKEIELPDSVVSIGRGAFRKCYNIESVKMTDSLTRIGIHSFSLCYKLKDIEFSKNLYSVGAFAFYNCSSMENVILPDATTIIGNGAFSACNNLKSISIGESSKSNLKYIGKEAFAGLALNCTSVDVTSNKIVSIRDCAFGYYSNNFGLVNMAKFSDDVNFNMTDRANKHLRENVNYFSYVTKYYTRSIL